jgi:alkanesulfonate monooxygenase SsuD/methylene tetrahydromethanopterin reductase-like flavin-dependent oxidoreductase (luciferase family)
VLEQALADAARPRDTVVCGLETFVSVRENADEALRDATSTLVYWYKDVDTGRQCNMIGTPKMVIDQMNGYVEIGVRHFELKFIARSLEDQIGMMRLIAAQVVPAFR